MTSKLSPNAQMHSNPSQDFFMAFFKTLLSSACFGRALKGLDFFSRLFKPQIFSALPKELAT